MVTAAEVNSRTKFLCLVGVAGSIAGLMVLCVQIFLIIPAFTNTAASDRSISLRIIQGVVGLALLLSVFALSLGSEWVADTYVKGEEFPIANRLFVLLPWPYLTALVVTGITAVFGITRGMSAKQEGVFLMSVFFLWFCPPEFRRLRTTANLATAAMCFAIWWSTSTPEFIGPIGVSFVAAMNDFRLKRRIERRAFG